MTAMTDEKPTMRADDLRRERLAARLKEARRPCFEPILETGDGAPSDAKMGGTPLGDPPTCKGCKQAMVLLLQLDPAGLPDGAPIRGKGLLQIFHCGRHDCDYGDTTYSPGGTGVVLRMGPPKESAKAKATDKPKKGKPKVVAKGQASRIIGWKPGFDLPGRGDAGALKLDAKELRLLQEQRSREGDKLGGHPSWIQSPQPATCPACSASMRFIFQLSARLVDFGDAGLGYVHQCEKHPAKLAFSWSST